MYIHLVSATERTKATNQETKYTPLAFAKMGMQCTAEEASLGREISTFFGKNEYLLN